MKSVALICGFFLAWCLPLLRAGSVTVLGDGPTVEGNLTLEPNTIRVQATPSPAGINLTDVLEADFGEAPFQLDYFSSVENAGDPLPEGWKAQNIGAVDTPGSLSYADGTFTLSGGGTENNKEEKFFFAGQPWSGDGQWTVRVKEIHADPQAQHTEAGLMLREGWEPNALQVWAGPTVNEDQLGQDHFRKKDGNLHYGTFSMQFPIWLRLTRSGRSIDLATSSDGKTWGVVAQDDIESSGGTWVGLYFDSHKDKAPGKAVFDQVTFTPLPAQASTVLPGILLRSGSFLTGGIGPFNSIKGTLFTKTRVLVIPTPQVAMITFYPVARSQLADAGTQSGLIMKNGDFLAGELQEAAGGSIRLSSVVLGIAAYPVETIRACVFQQVQPQTSEYEIRLLDGSILRAKSISVDDGQLTIEDLSGITLSVAPEDIAQVRAGSSRVQPLIDLPWKATAAPPANAAAAPDSLVQNWTGNNQEHILAVPAQTSLEFPLVGRFSAVALRVALGPGGPPNGQAKLHVLVNGQEITTTPAFKAGDQPLMVKVPIHDAKTVTFVADSSLAGTKVLLIDPVAIRGN